MDYVMVRDNLVITYRQTGKHWRNVFHNPTQASLARIRRALNCCPIYHDPQTNFDVYLFVDRVYMGHFYRSLTFLASLSDDKES